MTDASVQILTINSGSSSIKFSLYRMGSTEELRFVGKLDRIGVDNGHFLAQDRSGNSLVERLLDLPNHEAALQTLFDWLQAKQVSTDLAGVGHRLGPEVSSTNHGLKKNTTNYCLL